MNYFFNYNKIIAKLYSNKQIKSPNKYKDENYFIKISKEREESIKVIKEQLGKKIKISKEKSEEDNKPKLSSFSECIKPKRIDYLINTNQSKIILDFENDETKLDKDINICKKQVLEPGHIKLTKLLLVKSNLRLKYFFTKWRNFTEYPENHYYDNILEYFECVKNENVELEFNKVKVKNDYKKLIQDYKTLKNFFCEDCMNSNIDNNGNLEEFNLDMKSINSDSSNLTPSDLKADSNYNSELIINKNFRSNF